MTKDIKNILSIKALTLKFFKEHKKIAAARTYFAIQKLCSGHLHRSQFPELCAFLGISNRVLRNNIKQLEELGVIIEYSNKYWRTKKQSDFTIGKDLESIKIKKSDIKNIKNLHTLSYHRDVREAIKVAKKFAIKADGKTQSTVSARDRRLLAVPVAGDFVLAITDRGVTRQTISKHIGRLKAIQRLQIAKPRANVLFETNDPSEISGCITDDQYVVKIGNLFQLRQKEPNLIRESNAFIDYRDKDIFFPMYDSIKDIQVHLMKQNNTCTTRVPIAA